MKTTYNKDVLINDDSRYEVEACVTGNEINFTLYQWWSYTGAMRGSVSIDQKLLDEIQLFINNVKAKEGIK